MENTKHYKWHKFHSLLRFCFINCNNNRNRNWKKNLFFSHWSKNTTDVCVVKILARAFSFALFLYIQFTPLSLLSTKIRRLDRPPTMCVVFLFCWLTHRCFIAPNQKYTIKVFLFNWQETIRLTYFITKYNILCTFAMNMLNFSHLTSLV